jgi:hypothetical protein
MRRSNVRIMIGQMCCLSTCFISVMGIRTRLDALCMPLERLSPIVYFSFYLDGYLSTSLSRGTRWGSASLSSALGNLSPLTI